MHINFYNITDIHKNYLIYLLFLNYVVMFLLDVFLPNYPKIPKINGVVMLENKTNNAVKSGHALGLD